MAGIDISKIETKKNKPAKASQGRSLSDILNQEVHLFGKSWPAKKKEAFYNELGILLEADVDIRTALDIVGNGYKQGSKDNLLITQLKDQVVIGSTLSEALKESGRFSAYEIYGVEIGEETGRLSHVLAQLADYFKKSIKQKRQIVNALTYPILVMVIAVLAVVFMMYYIVPMFADVFKQFGGDLPAITKFVIAASHWFEDNGLWLISAVVGVVVVAKWQRNSTWYRKYMSMVLLRIPIVGPLVRKVQLSRMCSVLSLLLSSSIPLLKSMELVKKMISFYPIQESLGSASGDIMKGEPLHLSLAKFGLYDYRMISLVKVGEEVNQLDSFFQKIADQYNEEVEHTTGVLGNLLEPILLVFLGAIVGTILIAMYLPMFELSNQIGG